MFKFEKLLKDNNIAENDPELPRSLTKNIEKFRNLQKSITNEMPSEEKEKINDQLDVLDDKIMETLPEFFDILDEQEENKKQAEQQAKAKKEAREKEEAEKKEKAESEAKAKKEAEENELNLPATNDDEALDKLFRKGKKQVTREDLKAAGFNLSFWSSNLTPSGCTTKRYKLERDDYESPYYDLIKR